TTQNFFLTAPPVATARKIRIVAYGDCGNNSSNQVNVKNAYRTYVGNNATDLWLLLGDNAYNAGLDAEYQSNFFNVYKADLLKNIMLFPTPGNHDYANDATRQDDHNIPYLANFTLPKNGECGGVASGKEEYYSFDYGDIHFICLDSYGEENNKRFYDTTSAQILWLKSDLAANQRKWTIVFWHHPPYTMGSHNSDTESELVSVRMNLNRILERFGVDLVLNGHSHDYERSYLINDHFGLENTFSFATNAVSNSSAKYDGTANSCPYLTTSAKVKHGTVYVVAGSAGQLGGTQASFPHAAMYYSNATTGGSLVLEVQGNRLDAKFVAADNTIKDQFTIEKDVNKTSSVSLTAGQSTDLVASWIGNYSWSTGATTQSITISPAAGNYDYFVNDNANAASRCLADTFHVTVLPAGGFATLSNTTSSGVSLKVYPNPAYNSNVQLSISSSIKQQVTYIIKDVSGRMISSQKITVNKGVTDRSIHLATGVYFIDAIDEHGERSTQKLIVK
ncbi:MAG TPA: metallophosphoesterase, partial [Parafilimonas sp.]|nr:metallophosphoesterase [Parafilimonas sp.]